MLRGLVVLAQIASAQIGVSDTASYTSDALRDMVAKAAESNRTVPAGLRGYRSHIETETALIIRDTLGREHSAEIEQIASEGRWSRDGRYELHIVGYRSQNIGVPYSTLKSRVQRGRDLLHAELLGCCAVELDARGRVTDFEPRSCKPCGCTPKTGC